MPCVVSNIRGNKDLIDDNEWRFNPCDKGQIRSVLLKVINDEDGRMLQMKINKERIEGYRTEVVVEALKKIYSCEAGYGRQSQLH